MPHPFTTLAIGLLLACSDGNQRQAAPPPRDPTPTAHPEPQPEKKKTSVNKENRLAKEKSPYLRQHRHNPVDWFPWGTEAFEKAKREGKLIFLSIGYSSCHWCHVMEHESFDDEEVAKYLNDHFVSIKVDREERPDVDAVYMDAAQAMRIRGGWPLSIWMTADRKPFHAGTYFPKVAFLQLLTQIQKTWATPDGRKNLELVSRDLVEFMKKNSGGSEKGDVDAQLIELARYAAERASDRELGGWGQAPAFAPKFPSATAIELMLRYHLRRGDSDALKVANLALEKMALGGIHDHVGGGFHRYSTTRDWLVPHFEKMLYDNAQLLPLYAWAYRITGNELYRDAALDTARWVRREMTDAQGGFYTAQDADDPGGPEGEGGFYIWDPEGLEKLLGKDAARAVGLRYDVTDEGNWSHRRGKSILQVVQSVASVAKEMGRGEEEVRKLLAAALPKMYEAREKRPKPMTDTKVLAGWNGLMVSGFCRAYQALGEKSHLESALRAGSFVRREMWRDGRLLRRWADGEAAHEGVLDDYAWVIASWLDLYESTFDASWLRDAIALQKKADELFLDAAEGGYFYTAKDGEALIVRGKDAFDKSRPSGNSVMAHNLARLMHFTGNLAYRDQAKRTIEAFGESLAQNLFYNAGLLNALDLLADDTREIFIAGARDDPGTQALIERVWRDTNPNRVVALVTPKLEKLLDPAKDKKPVGGKAAAYVCRNFACLAPVTDPAEIDLAYDKPAEEKEEKSD